MSAAIVLKGARLGVLQKKTTCKRDTKRTHTYPARGRWIVFRRSEGGISAQPREPGTLTVMRAVLRLAGRKARPHPAYEECNLIGGGGVFSLGISPTVKLIPSG